MQTWKHFQANKQSERIDKSLENTAEEIKEIERVIWIGLLCTQEPVFRRPTMTRIVQMLKQEDTPLPSPFKDDNAGSEFNVALSQPIHTKRFPEF